ncbi:conserved hypothetical protein [Methanohalobium evestigatum Z-7303]|uniref:Uncharacterized protein n=1 Tax=Methanohalobium evestigatum (strain ATCC BAA-1072 / DSM 3721 / NBRC 107634 / OCM 161 / Z-7303) TaxID=644295 RepID=D7E7N3_METEZ|nr:conserved hypothetical protein [Methanohalobium evestigatum Z-7303]
MYIVVKKHSTIKYLNYNNNNNSCRNKNTNSGKETGSSYIHHQV